MKILFNRLICFLWKHNWSRFNHVGPAFCMRCDYIQGGW